MNKIEIISLHQILLDQPTAKVGVVTAAIEFRAIEEHASVIEQVNSVACCQSQGSAQGNGLVTRSRLLSKSTSNSVAVYLKIHVNIIGRLIFNSREIEMVNPRDWDCEDPRRQIKSISFVETSQFKRNYGRPTWQIGQPGIPLDVEVDGFRLYVDSSDEFLYN